MKKINSRTIQIALGSLWVLDAVLQMQPKMFTSAFANQVVVPAAAGQPAFVASPMHFAVSLLLIHPALFNLMFVLIQLFVGVMILIPRTLKLGLALSIVWGLFVWFLGEGFGGIFSGQTLLLMGAPGAAVIYSLIALAIYPKRRATKNPSVSYWLVLAWLVIWVGGGIYQLLPPNNSTAALSSMIYSGVNNSPSLLAGMDVKAANIVGGLGEKSKLSAATASKGMNMSGMKTLSGPSRPGFLFVLLLAVIEMSIGMGVLLKGWKRNLALGAGVLLSLCFWAIGQNLGDIFSGLATDLNSGPLFVLLATAVAIVPELDGSLEKLGSRISSWLIGKPKNQEVIIETS